MTAEKNKLVLKMNEATNEFLRIGGDAEFQGRSSSIFSCLDQLEPSLNKNEVDFKQTRPRAPMQVPDHILHPDKWTKYSLENEGTDEGSGMSGDALNKYVALSFMEEMRKRKDNSGDITAESDSDIVMSEKHIFSKYITKHKLKEEVSPKSQIVVGENVMAEKVVGKSPPKKSKAADKGKQDELLSASQEIPVFLDHLDETGTTDAKLDDSNALSGSHNEQQQDKEKFAKRKVKSRRGLRSQKSSKEEE